LSSSGNPPQTFHPLAAGWKALQRFYRPFILVQIVALVLATTYFTVPAVRKACMALAALKMRGGLPFVMAAGALAGGILPELFKALSTGTSPLRGRGRTIAFNTAFFAVNGAVVDAYYRLAARLFGEDGRPATVAAKVALDQFAFTPCWLAVIVFVFLAEKLAFEPVAIQQAMRPTFYQSRVLPLLVPNWCYWIPMVSIIYALPSPLQFLMFLLALSAWSLIMVFIARGNQE